MSRRHKEAEQHSYEERGNDKYPTPPEAVLALMGEEALPLRVWEPACGAGAIVSVLRDHGRTVWASDIERQGCPVSFEMDFLTEDAPSSWINAMPQAIVTNPPFRCLKAGWVERSLTYCPDVYLLLRLQFLEGGSEWRNVVLDKSGLRRVYVFRDRLPMMHRDGWTGPKATSRMAFAWFCWRRGWRGLTSVKRLSWKSPRLPLSPPTPGLPKSRCRNTPDMFAEVS